MTKATAQRRLGIKLHASLEVLHMADRDAAIQVIRTLVRPTDLVAFADALNAVGAGALARDVRNALLRTPRRLRAA